jgi:hypothetical protein
MPKRCNVLLETVKESPPLQVLKIKGDGLCHDQTVSRRLWSVCLFDLAISCVVRDGGNSQPHRTDDPTAVAAGTDLWGQWLEWHSLGRHHQIGDDVLREVLGC